MKPFFSLLFSLPAELIKQRLPACFSMDFAAWQRGEKP